MTRCRAAAAGAAQWASGGATVLTAITLAVSVGGGCAGGASAAADCNALLALDRRCDLRVGGLSPEACSHVYAFLSLECQEALHTYLACAGTTGCRQIADGNVCLQEGQQADIACSDGNASITTGVNGNTVTVPRGDLTQTPAQTPWRPSY